ncbi:rod-binding protein [Sneathiella limimaris]|uniref:rod-binding protein n=1 Tax=Sneathiella limimaris TaxID=1964213 RepID=UPI00146CF6F2|nr:rod-binding protein [Sneathiella limimaris]
MTDYLSHATAAATQATQATGKTAKPVDLKAKQTAEEFEAFFISQMFNHMSSGLQPDKTFGGGESEKVFRSMLNDEYAKSMSRQGGVGIAEMVYREILALQEV